MRYKYCPVCGSLLVYKQRDKQNIPVCQSDSCGFIFWQNSKPCASVLIPNDQGQVLMTVRARDPDKNKLDLPGGFLNTGEHPNDGARREVKEELGVEIEITDYLGFVIDRYGQDGEYTLNIGLVAKIISGIPRAADDVAAIEWIDPKTVTPDRLAFTNNQKFLKLWLATNPSRPCVGFFLYSSNDKKVLIHKRDDKEGIASPNMWDNFGGAFEPIDLGDAEKALERELYEELGISVNKDDVRFLVESGNETVFYVLFPKYKTKGLRLDEGAGFAWFSFEKALSIDKNLITENAVKYLKILKEKV